MKMKFGYIKFKLIFFIGIFLMLYAFGYLISIIANDGIIDYVIFPFHSSNSNDYMLFIKPILYDLFHHLFKIFSTFFVGVFFLLSAKELKNRNILSRHIVIFSSLSLMLIRLFLIINNKIKISSFFDITKEAFIQVTLISIIAILMSKKTSYYLKNNGIIKKYIIIFLLAFIFIASVFFNSLSINYLQKKISLVKEMELVEELKFVRLKENMSSYQVLEILGPPIKKEKLSNGNVLWIYIEKIEGSTYFQKKVLWKIIFSEDTIRAIENSVYRLFY